MTEQHITGAAGGNPGRPAPGDFEDIVKTLIVSGWHGAWRAAHQQIVTEAGGSYNVVDVGRRAWRNLPDDRDRARALDALFEAYWRNTLDFDIRNSLESHETTRDAAELRTATEDAARSGHEDVMVTARALARVLEDLEHLRLHRRHGPTYADEDGATVNEPQVTLAVEIDLTNPWYGSRTEVFADLRKQARTVHAGGEVRVRLGLAALDIASLRLSEEIAKALTAAATIDLRVPGGRREALYLASEVQQHIRQMRAIEDGGAA